MTDYLFVKCPNNKYNAFDYRHYESDQSDKNIEFILDIQSTVITGSNDVVHPWAI
jgi:hypothetical protein